MAAGDVLAPARPEALIPFELQRRASQANLVRSFKLDEGLRLASLTLGPDGRLCATGVTDDSTCLQVIEPDGRVSLRKTEPREGNFFQAATLSRDGQRIYLAERRENRLTALDATTGDELWSAQHVARRATLCPAQENPDGSVYFTGTGFGSLWSAQGEFLWEHDQGDSCTRANAFRDGTAYQGGTLGLVAVREGKTVWKLPRPGDAVYETVDPTEDGAIATLCTPDVKRSRGAVQSIDDRGNIRWTREFPDFVTRPVLADDGTIVVVDAVGVVHALAPEDGSPRWTRNLAFVTASDLLREPVEHGYPVDPARDNQGNLYIGWDDKLHCLSPDGRPQGTIQLDAELARIQDPLLAPDGTLYLHSYPNQVLAIDTRGVLAFRSAARLDEGAAIRVSPSGVRIGGVQLPVRTPR